MSPIGRIFIVLNLLLSAAFLGWAANALGTTQKFKDQLEAEKKAHADTVVAKDKELSDLQVNLNAVTDQQRTFREQRDSVQAEADRLKTQLDELKRTSEVMSGNLTKIQATLGDYNATIAQLTQQKDAAVERAHEAERARDSAVAGQQAAELAKSAADEATKNANLKIGDLNKEKADLLAQVDTLQTRMEVFVKTTGVDTRSVMLPPSIDAKVLDVNKDLKFVVLNKGKKDEVKVGYVFDVYSGSTYKGQVRISDVQDTISSGLILNEKSSISRGDSATTSL